MSCADVQTIQAGNGVKTQFSFDFPYIFKSEVQVSFWNATTKEWDVIAQTDATYPWQVTDANPTIVEFTGTAPPPPAVPVDPNETAVDNVKIRRVTNIEDIRALFNPGSAIRSDDLNKNFEQLRYAIQESNCQGVTDEVYQYLLDNYWDRFDNTLYSADAWRSDDATIATTAALDQRFQDEVNDTFTKAELAANSNIMPNNDDAIPTTGALNDYINEVITNDIGTDGTGITVTDDGDGTITLGIAANSVDLDRIKNEDVITSSETWVSDNNKVATTGAIDARTAATLDAYNQNGITTDGTGITLNKSYLGVEFGLGPNSIDLDRIKDSDIITVAEQDAGSPAPADTNIFTALAAARRFDTFVQTSTPVGSDWEVGKTWLQNDPDKTLSIWDGAAWVGISSGGTFTSQSTVVYVDAVNGDDANDGHRISRPKKTIKAAVNQLNSEIEVTIENGGSGYVEGTYVDVPLTGGTGTGVLATIVVNVSGVVTSVTVTNPSALVDTYTIGETLSASNTNLGGSGSGLILKTTGTGDGQVVVVAPGIYQEVAPIQIKRRDVSIIGQALRSCIIHPTVAAEENTLFEVNSGSFLQNLTFTGVKASGARGGNVADTDATYGLPTNQGWNVAFYNDAIIIKSPYIQNCTNFSDSEIDNSDLNAHRPAGGSAGDTDSAVTGGGLFIDGSVVNSNSPLRSMVCDSYTHVGLDGPGIFITNNGYCQATSSYSFFTHYHIKCLNGGQANLAASTTDFGRYSLIADGKSPTAIFTATTTADAADQDITFTIGTPVADASWHGTATRPQSNMLVEIGGNIYPILSATANGTGWDVTISRPNPANRSINLGLDGAVLTGASVSFYLRSMIASSGHTMEYVGSGTDYSALPENGGVPVDANQLVELNGGKIWTATTDHNGKFKVGDVFEVNQQTGYVSIPLGSFSSELVTDPSPELAADLDANNFKISNLANPVTAQDAATKAYVDTAASSGFIETPKTLTTNKVIADNTNAACIGPIAVNTGVTITIGSNSKLVVLN